MADFYETLKETATGLIRQFGSPMIVRATSSAGAVSTNMIFAVRTQRSKATNAEGVPVGDWEYIAEAPDGVEIGIGNTITFAGSNEVIMLADQLKPAGTRMVWQLTTRFG